MNLQNPKEEKRKLRIRYAVAFGVLLFVEVLIALFVHDTFVRPYVGDMLVVIVLYCLIRVFIPMGCRLLSLYIFLFAAAVECLQYFDPVQMLGLSDCTFLRVLVGSVFDGRDILCYAAGCVVLFAFEVAGARKGRS